MNASTKVVSYKGQLLIPFDNRVQVMVPHATRFQHEGQELMLVPHNVDETSVLRNLGYDVRPPMMENYDWNGDTPFDTQRITAALITTNRRSYVLNGIGTGKTRSVLYAYDYLKKAADTYGKLLVTAPLSTLRQTWEREVTMVFPHLKVAVLHGHNRAKRIKQLNLAADVWVINHDGVETIFNELMERKDEISMMALDELSVYKNAQTDLWKYTNKLAKEIDRVTGLTATPMPTAATDAYGQIKMLTPQNLQDRSFGRFRELMQIKVSEFRWVNKRDAKDDVFKMMQPGVRFTRDECYDMPPCQTVIRECAMSVPTHKLFKEMGDESALAAHGIAAANGADKINKMLQIALGGIYMPDRTVLECDVKSRLKLLEEACEESASKVIVFTPYKSSLKRLAEHLGKRWTVATISGDVANSQREQIFTMFRHAPDPQILVAHPATMSHGLTLTEASTIVWWGPPGSLEEYEQANGRITRAGQRHSQLIVCLASSSLELQIYKVLERRGNVQQALLDMYENQDTSSLS